MHIGAQLDFNYFSKNDLDELGIYNRALSAAEILAIYNAGSAGKCPPPPCAPVPAGLISWWPGQNSTADVAGGNNGTVAGFGTFGYGEA